MCFLSCFLLRLARATQLIRFGVMEINEPIKPKNVGQLPGIVSTLCTVCTANRGTRFILYLSFRASQVHNIYLIYICNCSWVVTRWQQYSTHLHTNSTQNDTKQTVHRTTQQFGRVRAVPRLGQLYPGICLATEEKGRKTSVRSKNTQTTHRQR